MDNRMAQNINLILLKIKYYRKTNKTGMNLIIIIFMFVENSMQYYTLHYFSVWLRTGYNPADINRFRSHTGKYFNWCMKF